MQHSLACSVYPMSSTVDFMDQVEGDQNRQPRGAHHPLLPPPHVPRSSRSDSALQRSRQHAHGASTRRLRIDFTTWYLTKKKYITRRGQRRVHAYGRRRRLHRGRPSARRCPLLERLLTCGSQHVDSDAASDRLPAPPPPSGMGGCKDVPVGTYAASQL